MAHPMHEHKAHKVERRRVSHITKAYAKGGAVKEIGKKSLALHKEEHKAIHAEGDGAKHRMDRPKRARGGKVKGKSNARTVINVITGHPGGGAAPPPMPAGIAPAAMPPAGGPPMMAKPPMPGAGMPPPGMPPMRAKGGAVKSIGMHVGTEMQHSDGKATANKNLGRGKPVTFKSGGRVRSFYARGGKIESPHGVAKATKLPGGGGGGEARLVKASRAKREYHGAD